MTGVAGMPSGSRASGWTHSTLCRAVDQITTFVLGLVAVAAATCAIWGTGFFVMATDSCYAHCDTSAVREGVWVTWTGTAVAVIGMALGIMWSKRHGRPSFFWPLLATLAIAAALLLGWSIALTATSP